MKSFAVTWDHDQMQVYREWNPAAIMPDAILWGVAIDGIHNPSLSVLLEKLESMAQSIQHGQQTTHNNWRARLGNWLVSLGKRIAREEAR